MINLKLFMNHNLLWKAKIKKIEIYKQTCIHIDNTFYLEHLSQPLLSDSKKPYCKIFIFIYYFFAYSKISILIDLALVVIFFLFQLSFYHLFFQFFKITRPKPDKHLNQPVA